MKRLIVRFAHEPVIRLFTRELLKPIQSKLSLATRMAWDLSPRPTYLLGLGRAALEAKRLGIPHIYALEFGVAGGSGLLALEREATAIEREVGVRVSVRGFDTGAGLPAQVPDHRNHTDFWKSGDFPMNHDALRRQLKHPDNLILGEIADTVPAFLERLDAPVAFIAVDVDFYTSAVSALRVLTLPGAKMLPHTPIYFDDIMPFIAYSTAGELCAIDEFNAQNPRLRIEPWRGVKQDRAFPEAGWLDGMYVAHNYDLIEGVRLERERRALAGPGVAA